MENILDGMKVLDLTRVLAGPYATMILADLGAEVIKVELPEVGDEARSFGPFQNGESAYFSSVNRGKKSITIDLRTHRGGDIVRQLLKDCDVIVENFRPGSMDRFGLGYDQLSHSHPHLVYASISGFGQTGPYAKRPAYDVIIQAMGGISSITGNPGEPPVRVGSSIADLSAALFSTIGILAAWGHAKGTGFGQQIDVSMLDCQVALLENAIARYYLEDSIPGPIGSRHPTITPFQFFRASDGYIVIAIGNDGLWSQLCRTLGVCDLITDSRFIDNASRSSNQRYLDEILQEYFIKYSVEHWLDKLEQAGIPCGPIQDIEQVCNDPQIAERKMLIEIEHPVAGPQKMPNSPLKFSSSPIELLTPAPLLGEHTREILKSMLGMKDEEVVTLRSAGII